jgi:hypothetical protein
METCRIFHDGQRKLALDKENSSFPKANREFVVCPRSFRLLRHKVLALHQFEDRGGEFPRRFMRRVVADPRQEAALIGPRKERSVLF